MPIICKHGLDERSCATCRQARETEPLRRDALRVTEEGKPALLLRTVLGTLNVTVLVLDGKTIRFETVKEISLRHPMTVLSFDQRKVLNLFLDHALRKGYLFRPSQELTCPEQVEAGPPRCSLRPFRALAGEGFIRLYTMPGLRLPMRAMSLRPHGEEHPRAGVRFSSASCFKGRTTGVCPGCQVL